MKKNLRVTQAVRAYLRLVKTLDIAESQDYEMDGSGDATMMISNHYDRQRELLAIHVSEKFAVTEQELWNRESEIAAISQEAQLGY